MNRLIFVRHGETEWNRQGNRYCGRSDVPLSEAGRNQITTLAQTLRRLDVAAVYSSGLARARTSANIIGDCVGQPVATDDRLREIDFGLWEGLTSGEISDRHASGLSAWNAAPDQVRAGDTGETGAEVVQRMLDFCHSARSQGLVVAVCHNTALRLFIAATLEMPLRQYRRLTCDNAGLCECLWDGDGFLRWVRINQSNGGQVE